MKIDPEKQWVIPSLLLLLLLVGSGYLISKRFELLEMIALSGACGIVAGFFLSNKAIRQYHGAPTDEYRCKYLANRLIGLSNPFTHLVEMGFVLWYGWVLTGGWGSVTGISIVLMMLSTLHFRMTYFYVQEQRSFDQGIEV